MKRIKVNGVELWVETFGDPADRPVLLVGVTMLSWPDELCAALAGRYVVRYDLRDAGQSTFADPDAPAYDLRDLVTDASELLVALDLGVRTWPGWASAVSSRSCSRSTILTRSRR